MLKKRLISGREYTDLVMDYNIDKNRSSVELLRTSFLYDGHYFQIETCINLPGAPTFLRLENHENGDISMAPFVKILRDVTTEYQFTTKQISYKGNHIQWLEGQ